jgi:phosphatidylglycerophosphatase A
MNRRINLFKPSHFIASAGGVGLFPLAPGTVGSLLAYPLYLATRSLPSPIELVLVSALYLLGVWATGQTEKDLEKTDPSLVVWDEVVGFYVALQLAPADWRYQLAVFVLFRLLDIFKPWPISAVQRRLKGGNGIMLDDLLAGLAAGGALFAINIMIYSKL